MQRDHNGRDSIVCRKFMRFYGAQAEEQRAAILGFLHLVEDDAARALVHLRIQRSGRVKLNIEVRPAIGD